VCPFCRSDNVHRAHRRTLADRLLHLSGWRVLRCSACYRRFHRHRYLLDHPPGRRPNQQVRREQKKRRSAIRRRELLMLGMAALFFCLFLLLLVREQGA
jgi:hypothetical protein